MLDVEALLREKDIEIRNLRETMANNEGVIFQVCLTAPEVSLASKASCECLVAFVWPLELCDAHGLCQKANKKNVMWFVVKTCEVQKKLLLRLLVRYTRRSGKTTRWS